MQLRQCGNMIIYLLDYLIICEYDSLMKLLYDDVIQWASHNWPIDNKDADLSYENTLASLVDFGSSGMSKYVSSGISYVGAIW